MGILLTIIFGIFYLILFPLGELARIDLQNNIAVTGIDIGVGVLLVSTLVLLRTHHKNVSLLKPIGIFLGVCLLSLVSNFSNLKQNEFLVSFLYLLRFAAYTSVYFLIAGLPSAIQRKIRYFLILSGGLLLTGGYLQFFFYPSLRNLYYLGWDVHLYRMFSSFLDPNFFGAFLVLYMLFLLSTLSFKRLPRSLSFTCNDVTTIFLLLLLISTVIGIVLTYSRSAYIMAVVGVITYFFVKRPSKKIIYSAVVILGIGVISYFGFTKYSEGTNLLRGNSSKARIATSENALIIFQKNPVFGVGFNAYRYAQNRYHFLSPNQSHVTVDHGAAGTDNSFLFVLATTGIIGLFAYLYLLWCIVKQQKKNLQKNMLAPVIISSVLALCIDSFFVNSLFYSFIMIWMWTVVGLGERLDKDF